MCVCVCSFLSILVLVTIFEMGTIFMTRPSPSLISALFFIVFLCAFCFSIPVVVTIFVRRTIFMNCPPPSHSMWCFFVVCVHFFGSIIELYNLSDTYLSVKRDIFMMEIQKKNKKKKQLGFDLIVRLSLLLPMWTHTLSC